MRRYIKRKHGGELNIIIDLDNPPPISREDGNLLKCVPSSVIHGDQQLRGTQQADEDFIDDSDIGDPNSCDDDEDEDILSDNDTDSS